MTKWRKITIGVCGGLFLAAVIYDIIVVTQSPGDTESNVIFKAIYNFPFIAFALGVIAGHWTSFFTVPYSTWPALAIGIGISVLVLAASILMAVQGWNCGIATACAHLVNGFVTGALCWSQRRIY